jgi:hypothetical protein
MGNVQSIPADKLDRVSDEEREEFEAFRNGDDNLYEAGIRVGDEGFYDPTAGSKYEKTQRPTPSSNEQPRESNTDATPLKAGANTQTAKVISRERNSAVDKSEAPVVDSKGTKATGRKASTSGE